MKKVTIQDVARELQLSRNTVAKALNNMDSVSYETRYIVIKKAYEMGYSKLSPVVINEFSVKEAVEKSKTIVVLARRELSVFWNRIIMGISDELNKHNCKLQFNFISREDEELGNLPLDLQSDVRGIILLSVFLDPYVDLLINTNIPIVFLDAPVDFRMISSKGDILFFEGKESVKKLVWHLMEQDIQRIGFIGDITYCRTIADRFYGYQEALLEAGLEVDDKIIKVEHVNHRYYHKEEIQKALDEMPLIPQGLICANDDIARDVIMVLEERGILVPEEVAVTGFDHKGEFDFMKPGLTTVHIGTQRMGRRLVQQLMWRIENWDMPKEVIYINTQVIIGESSIKTKEGK